jgi:hypothetical protein
MANNLPYTLHPGKENAYRQGMSSSYTPGTNVAGYNQNRPAPPQRQMTIGGTVSGKYSFL